MATPYGARATSSAGEPFLHLVGDHLTSPPRTPLRRRNCCASPKPEESSVSAVQLTREGLLPNFGAVGGRRMPGRPGVYRGRDRPREADPNRSRTEAVHPGMRAGYYLCFFGMHAFTPTVIEILTRQLASSSTGRASLSAGPRGVGAPGAVPRVEEPHRRYDIGARYGLLTAQLALALNGPDRAEILAQIVELLASQELAAGAGGRRSESPHRGDYRGRSRRSGPVPRLDVRRRPARRPCRRLR